MKELLKTKFRIDVNNFVLEYEEMKCNVRKCGMKFTAGFT